MSAESMAVLVLFWAFVLHRRHTLTSRLREAEARVKAQPLLPLMRQPGRKLPWE